jgi:CIC family chloride channel protein
MFILPVRARLVQYLIVSSLTGLTIGIIVSLVANAFVNGIRYFEALRSTLISNFILFQFSEYLFPFLWLAVGFVLVVLIKKIVGCATWQGPADAIYCAHRPEKHMDFRQGFGTVLAAFTSLSAGASLGQYGPIVHMGALIGGLFRKYKFSTVGLSNDIFLGCGVAAAISAGFQAPIAGVIFAHEAILRHFSARAVAPIAISSICAASVAERLNLSDSILVLNFPSDPLLNQVPALLVGGFIFSIIAVFIMKSTLNGIALVNKFELPIGYLAMIAVFGLGSLGILVPETVGIGMKSLLAILSGQYEITALLLLFFAKILAILISICFGFVGGFVSPALIIGALSGALLSAFLSAVGFDVSTVTLMIAGMAAVSGTIVGAPISMVMLVFELTESYDFAVSAMLSVVVANLFSHLAYSHSLFDEQLKRRNIDVSVGRINLALMEKSITEITQTNFLKIAPGETVARTIDLLKKEQQTEAYCVAEDGTYVGKLFLPQLLEVKPHTKVRLSVIAAETIIPATSSMFEAIEIASDFVGEAMAVVNQKNGLIIGVVTEADIFSVYLEAQSDVHKLEHG